MCAGFYFVAEASDIQVLKIFAVINLMVLAVTIGMFFHSWHIRFISEVYQLAYRRLRWVNFGLGALVQLVLMLGALYAFMKLVDAFKFIAKTTCSGHRPRHPLRDEVRRCDLQ